MTSVLTGPDANIYAATTIPGTAAVAMTEFQAHGNSVILVVTTAAGGGCGSLTFTAECKYKIAGTDTAYADVIDSNSVWSMVVTTPNAAGVYAFPLEGLDLAPVTYCRLSYTAGTAAGNVKVDMLNWDNPQGGGAKVSVGDVVVDIDAIAVDVAALEILLADIPNVIGTDNTVGPTKTLSIGGTNSADGKIQEVHVDAAGDLQVDVLTLPGGLTGFAEDIPHTDADVGLEVLVVRNDALASLCDADGDYVPVQVDAAGAIYTGISDVLGATMTAANPLLAELTDGAAVISPANPLSVNVTDGTSASLLSAANTARVVGDIVLSTQEIGADGTVAPTGSLVTNAPFTKVTDGTNTAVIGTGTTKTLSAGIHDGELLAAVHTNAAMADDLDGINGLVTASVVHGYVDDNTTRPVLVDATGHPMVDVAVQTLTAVKVSATAAANTAANPMFSELTDGAAVISTTNPLSVNLTDGTSASLISDANTARAATDHVLSTQGIGADGTVAPTGSLLTNAPFAKLTDGTTDAIVNATTVGLQADLFGVGGALYTLGTAAMAASMPITHATDDTQLGTVGEAAAAAGAVHAQLRSIAEGVVAGAALAVDPQTGSAAIAYTTSIAADFELTSITLTLSAAGTTAEDFTLGLDALDGADYDTNLLTLDLSTDSIVDLVLTPQNYPGLPRYYEAGDELAFVWPNTEVRTYGLRIVTKGV